MFADWEDLFFFSLSSVEPFGLVFVFKSVFSQNRSTSEKE